MVIIDLDASTNELIEVGLFLEILEIILSLSKNSPITPVEAVKYFSFFTLNFS